MTTVSADGRINICTVDGKVSHSVVNPEGGVRIAATDGAGQLLLTTSKNGNLMLWDTSDGAQVATLPGHKARVTSMRIDAAGRFAVSVDSDGQVRRWDLRTRDAVEFNIEKATAAEISPDGQLLLVTGDPMGSRSRKAWLIAVETGDVKDITQDGGTRDAQFSRDGQQFGLLSTSRHLEIFDTATRQVTATINPSPPSAFRFAFSADGGSVALDHGTRVSCWSVSDTKEIPQIPTTLTRQTRPSNLRWNPFLNRSDELLLTRAMARKYSRTPLKKAESEVPRRLLPSERLQFHLDLTQGLLKGPKVGD